VTINQFKGVTVYYLRANPVNQSGYASALVFTGTRRAWPRSKKKWIWAT
jgi:hypothetical protein